MSELVDIAARGRISRTRQKLIEATTNDVIPAKQRWSQPQQINSDLCKSVCDAAAHRGDQGSITTPWWMIFSGARGAYQDLLDGYPARPSPRHVEDAER
jgi:hypothetical protein